MNVAQNNNVNVAVGISILELDVGTICVYIFSLCLLISNVAMVVYQSILRYTVGMLGEFLHLYHYNESHSLDYHS